MARALLSGGFTALLGVLLAMTPFGMNLEERFGLDSLFRLRGPLPAPKEVVVVAIDRDSSETIGTPWQLDRWSRAHHARLLERIASMGAEVIAFDMLFAEPRDEAGDTALASAMREAGNVALVYMLERERQAVNDALGGALGTLAIEQRRDPLAAFSDAALTTAPFVLPKVAAPVHRYWHFKPDTSPSLPVAALQIYSLPSYDAWRRLWRQVDAGIGAQLPERADSLIAKRQVLALAGAIRQRLRESPDLALRLQERLARSGESAETKHLLTALIRAYAGSDSGILNIYGGPGAVTTLPFHRLLDRSPGPDLRGKAVFIGFAERRIQAQRDGFATVFSQDDGRDLAGVEIAAMAFANLLNGEEILPLSPPAYWGLLLLWGGLLGLAGRRLTSQAALAVIVGLGLAYFSAAYHLFAVHTLWLPLVVPLCFQAPSAFFLGLAMRYRESARQRERLKEAFSHYLPPDVVRRYRDEETAPATGGRLMYGTCLFSDAAQYTRLSEQLEPAALGRLVNDYYASVFTPVRGEGGIVSDVVGDAMLALWTAEAEGEVSAARACTAALTIIRNIRREADAGLAHALPTRIGLHAGPILLGNVGAGDHFEYRAVGDTVNTATRIEGLNKLLGTHLLASDAVVRSASGMVFRPVGRFVPAGKTQVLGVHELLDPETASMLTRESYMRRYREGLDAVADGNWEEAWKLFVELEREQPQDGPSRYYRLLSETFRQRPPTTWDGVIRLSEK